MIGDTPRDIACARADEVRVAAVATGFFTVTQLADADAVVDDARALLPVLTDWAAAVALAGRSMRTTVATRAARAACARG